MNVFDEESRTILIEQELDKVSMHTETGKIKMLKTDLNTFSSLVNKYGVEKVARANKSDETQRMIFALIMDVLLTRISETEFDIIYDQITEL